MPDTVGAGSDPENYRATTLGVDDRHGIVDIGAKPGVAAVETSANVAAVVVQDDVFSICAAGELGVGDFDGSVLEARLAGVGDGNPPKHCRSEIRGLGNRIAVSRFVADFVRNAIISCGGQQQHAE